MSAYFYLARMKILVSLTYRFEVIAAVLANLILMLSGIFLWKAAYSGLDAVAGVSGSQMTAYAVISVLLGSFYNVNVEFALYERIRHGNIAVDFSRPVSLPLSYLAEDVGQSAGAVLNRLLPLALITAAFIRVPAPAGPAAGLLFLLSSFLGFMILWTISALIGTLCFWYVELGNIGTIRDGAILLLSGKLIPLWFFPEGMQNVLRFLPFQYIYQTPLSIYIGQLRMEQTAFSLFIQSLWAAVLLIILRFTWKRAGKRVLIQGG